MSASDHTDAGSIAPTVEEVVFDVQRQLLDIGRTLARVEARLGTIEQRVGRIEGLDRKVDGLAAKDDKLLGDLRSLTTMTARAPSGQTLINLVALIHEKVRTL